LQKGATIDERLGRIHSFCRKWVENPRSSRIEVRPNPKKEYLSGESFSRF
jgi:hypothetical protein